MAKQIINRSQYPTSALGYTQVTTDQNTAGVFDVTGVTTTVTVPAGARIRITAYLLFLNTAVSTAAEIYIMEGSTVLSTGAGLTSNSASAQVGMSTVVYLSPSAGSHTYKVRVAPVAGTLTIKSSTSPAFIAVDVV